MFRRSVVPIRTCRRSGVDTVPAAMFRDLWWTWITNGDAR
jgi:hypothetical protein